MNNPWQVKNRLDWKIDPNFEEFNQKLFDGYWSFEDTCKNVLFDKYLFQNQQDRNQILESMKSNWLKYVNEWNRIEKINVQDKAKGFVAITYFYIVIPYKNLDNIGKYFTLFEADNINIAYFYNMNGNNLPFADMEELSNTDSLYPGTYQKWLDNKYNQASWWICYMVYEKINELSPIIDSSPANLK